MRLLVLSLVLLLSTLAFGQVMVVGGNATTGPVGYDVYSAPFTPRIVTPSVNLTSTPTGTQAVVYQGEVSAPLLYIRATDLQCRLLPRIEGILASLPMRIRSARRKSCRGTGQRRRLRGLTPMTT